MPSCKCEFLDSIDMFGKEPEFYYKQKAKKSTIIGKLFTILYLLAYVSFFIYKIIKMMQREDVTFYDTFAFTGEFPSIQLTNDNFYGGFGLVGADGEPFVEESIYYAKATFWSGKKDENGHWIWKDKDIPLERCKIEKFGSKYQDMFRDKDLNNLYCLSNVDVILEGYSTSDVYSYFEVKIYPCIDQTPNGSPCQPLPLIQKFMTKNQFMFKAQDIELTPQNYSSPVQEREKDIAGPVYANLLQQIYAYMQVTNIETDEDIIGFGLSNIKKEKYLKYDLSWIISAPMPSNIFETGDPLCEIYVQLSEKALTQKRSYTTLIEVLGDVGGLMEVLITFVNLVVSIIVDNSYETSIINNLFDFDLDKKIIIIKNKKHNNNLNLEDEKVINQVKHITIIPPTSNNENNNQTNNKYNDDPLSENKLKNDIDLASKDVKKTKKKKKKKKINIGNIEKIKIISPIAPKENNNIYNKNSQNEFSNSNSNYNTERGKENSELKRRIITKIKQNKFCKYFCFFYTRKRKQLENTLLDEGMKIVIDQLDIMNIFRKIYRNDLQDSLRKEEVFEMSETCKIYLHNLTKKRK